MKVTKKYFEVEVEVNIGQDDARHVTFWIESKQRFNTKDFINKLEKECDYGYCKVYGYSEVSKKPSYVNFKI